jgi:isoquinoline 1-oxidoreductase
LARVPARIIVNGTEREVEGRGSLLIALRDELGLTGAKPGCGEGACGACTVLVEGEPTRACITDVDACAGREVTTVEGLAAGGALSAVQQSFVDAGAMQCGYCTPGMVLAATALLATNAAIDDATIDDKTIRAALEPNVCRCCAYPRILDAVRHAATQEERRSTQLPAPRPAMWAACPRPRTPWDLARPAERDWFALLPEGLVVTVPPPEDPPGGFVGTGGAWLHVDASGSVTAFTGKVDVGQGTRHALRVAVARELGWPIARIELVMGDTDVCPFDIGTFGSRAMPTALPDLRVAAAATKVELDRLGISGPNDAAAPLTAQRLVVDARREQTLADASTWSATDPELDLDLVAAVTGTRQFPSDVARPGMWHARVLRPPDPGRRRLRAELDAARGMPGVTIVEDGDLVAVVAPDEPAATAALRAVAVEWSENDLVGESRLSAHLRAHPVEPAGWGGPFAHEVGDVETALARVPVRATASFTAAYLAHVPLETRVATAEWDEGRLTVWTATQQPFNVRRAVAEACGVDQEAVRIVVPSAGGGFGGKHDPGVAIEAARVARIVGRPVRVRWTREEEFAHAYFRPAAVIDVAAGVTSDGDLVAWDFTNVNSGAAGIGMPYTAAHQRLRFQPAESPLRIGAYRALAATANCFARESVVDELALAVHADPLDFRLRNLPDERLRDALLAVADGIGWRERPREAGLGAGIACGIEKGGRIATAVLLRVDTADGRLGVEVLRIVTAFDCGAVVDPDRLRNQIEGATIMGLGGALFEGVRFDAHHLLNGRLSDYRVPRFGDVPPIDVILMKRPHDVSAGGGETPIIAIAPALANAIHDACGRRLRSLPLLGAARDG